MFGQYGHYDNVNVFDNLKHNKDKKWVCYSPNTSNV